MGMLEGPTAVGLAKTFARTKYHAMSAVVHPNEKCTIDMNVTTAPNERLAIQNTTRIKNNFRKLSVHAPLPAGRISLTRLWASRER